jgi:hypothetical protein
MTRMTRRITDPSVSITETEISDAVEIQAKSRRLKNNEM